MADPKKRLEANAPGSFFVDSTCINCDTCRQLAPDTFSEHEGYSRVDSQPTGHEEERRALQALLACPTGSIGTSSEWSVKAVMDDFPLRIENGVYYCGFNSPRSYGANSYLLSRESGNWLIDSPKYLSHLVTAFEELGGIAYIFLTHRDDVADAAKYARRFGSRRIIHRHDLDAQSDAELVIEGQETVSFEPGIQVIPTSGHTRGHCLLLCDNRYLFTGDHLYFDRDEERLAAFPDHCWYSWEEQTASMRKLIEYEFEWILPGHGQRVNLGPARMKLELESLVERMEKRSSLDVC